MRAPGAGLGRVASPSRPPRCLARGSLQTSLILPLPPGQRPAPLWWPLQGAGPRAEGRREPMCEPWGSAGRARGSVVGEEKRPWGAMGRVGGVPPPLSHFATALFLHTVSRASPGLSLACPAWCLGLSTFLRKMWVCCKGELRQERK